MSDSDGRVRCPWCLGSEIYKSYHDEEWGRPCHDEEMLFEFLVLEGAQAGLSWLTVLKRRDAYREAFSGFDPVAVAAFGPDRVESLMKNSGIIRNRAKITSSINNAARFLDIRVEFGSFDRYIWGFTGGEPVVNNFNMDNHPPSETDISRAMSRDLRKRGFSFVGPTICYAFMQAVGIVNDHYVECWLRDGGNIPAPAFFGDS
ncbi:MAG: DNA-3-methyladenine glycosylase I [Synergistaceae bacterium]|nr:DNA-3-methyladenine glycosylase I [Synergistaceae bacterium]